MFASPRRYYLASLQQPRRRVPHAMRWLVGLTVSLLVAGVGTAAADHYCAAQPCYQVSLEQATNVSGDLSWATRAARTRLADTIHRSLTDALRAHHIGGERLCVSLFEPDLTRRIATALAESRWVRFVTRVAIEFPKSVRIQLVIARPKLAAQTESGIWLLDDESRVLPLGFPNGEGFEAFNRDLRPPLRVLTHVPPLVNDGRPNVHPALRAGQLVDCELARANVDEWPIETIDIRNVGGVINKNQSEIVLGLRVSAQRMVRVLWGRDPSRANAVSELPTAEKLAHLRRYLTRPDFDPATDIDLRFPPPRVGQTQ